MKKIPTLFKRDFTQPRHPITPEYNDGVEWVLQGEGKATRKYDGTCALIRGGQLYKRYELKPGKQAPYGFEQVDYDEATGKGYGWLEVGNGSEDRYFREAWNNLPDQYKSVGGTYELVGPKVQSNPEKYEDHRLIWHKDAQVLFPPVSFDELRDWLDDKDIEGVVWHHPDGRMVKIKKKDFGLKR
jgi:hypothetical protein